MKPIQTPDRRKRRSRAGVTLIEMLVVVTIIALFAAIVGPKLLANADRAKITAAHVQINAFMGALGQYKLDVGNYPNTEMGLSALRIRPEGQALWSGPYMPQDPPLDPWGHAYLYKYPGDHGEDPDIVSLGADGQPGGENNDADIVSWKNK
jgi:general secretion pathway protein G